MNFESLPPSLAFDDLNRLISLALTFLFQKEKSFRFGLLGIEDVLEFKVWKIMIRNGEAAAFISSYRLFQVLQRRHTRVSLQHRRKAPEYHL